MKIKKDFKLKDYLPRKRVLVLATGLIFGEALFSLLLPLIYMNFIDSTDLKKINIISISIIVFVFLIQIILGALQRFIISYVAQYSIKKLRLSLWKKVLMLPINFFDEHTSGGLMSHIVNDTQIVKNFISEDLTSAFSGTVLIIGSVILLFIIDWKITLIMAILIGFIVLVVMPLGNFEYKISKSLQKETADMQSSLGRALADIRLVKFSTAEQYEIAIGEKNINKVYNLGVKEGKFMAIIQPFSSGLLMLLIVVIFGYGALRIYNGDLTPGSLAAIIYCLFQIMTPCVDLTQFYSNYNKFLGACENLEDIYKTSSEKSVIPVKSTTINEEGLVFDHVKFSYGDNDKEKVLRDISFEIKKNQQIGIVGLSGAGKTTILSLIERFYFPQCGNIYYNGKNINTYPLKSWRMKIAYVSQDTPIMEGSIRDNLVYGMDSYEDSSIDRVIKEADLYDFISQLDDGYNTQVGEKGVKLSGGQKQRIAIARALMRNPEILLLDEATAHLDGISESKVQSVLEHLMKDRITIIVAHRLSTVKNVSKLIILEDGQITAQGTHNELEKNNSLYNKLVQQQLKK